MACTFAGQAVKGDEIYRTGFEHMDDFWVEGSPDVKTEGGSLFVRTTFERDEPKRFICSVFLKQVFEGDLLVRYRGRSIDDESHRNFNLFVHTTLPDGRDLYETRGERTGDYPEYHVMNNYLFTCLRSDQQHPDGTAMFRYRMRRDPGFILKKEAHAYECVNHRWYTFEYLVRKGQIGVCVDELPHETYTWHDEAPLTNGYLGLRTYMSALEFKDLEVYALKG